MKRIFLLLVLAAVLVLLTGTFAIAREPTCNDALPYRIGTIDPRFEITADELRPLLSRAEAVWETRAGKDLLGENSEAELRVDFVFDERQVRTLQSKKLNTKLETLEQSQEQIEKEYGTTSALYKATLAKYEKKQARYQKKLEEYNKDVAYWNKRGGAPQKEFNALKDSEEELDDLFSDLERDRKKLNSYAKQTGTLAEKDSALVENYNEEVASFEETYGEPREFDQGVYTGDAITIYQYLAEEDLVLALAHEFGHALSIGHVDDPEALMHPVLGAQDLERPGLQSADLTALEQACRSREFVLTRLTRTLLERLPR